MPSRHEVAYFGAGPAPLPTPVIEAAAQALINYNNTGIGLAEISHRSPTANQILADTKANLTTLLDIPDTYEILFMQGGGSGQFSAAVQNLVGVWVQRRWQRWQADAERKKAGGLDEEEWLVEQLRSDIRNELKVDYIVTGSWSLKAAQEATRLLGEKYVNIAVDARKPNGGKFGIIPPEDTWSLTPTKREGGKGAALVYYCDNETVDGVEFPGFPKVLEPQGSDEEDERLVVADMSSNFLSRKVDVSKYAVIFVSHAHAPLFLAFFFLFGSYDWKISPDSFISQAGAQKNVGAAGVTVVIVRKSLLPPQTPSPDLAVLRRLDLGGIPGAIVLDYAAVAKNNSLYNTLPIFNLWIAGQVIARLVQKFGAKKVGGQEEIANQKASLIYATLGKYPEVYHVVPDRTVRSRMNICFRVHGGDPEKEKEFLSGAEKRLLQGLKGHRSVGGIRVSNYNAVPLENAEKLVQYLEDYVNGP
jgi:phosphoserine aminotransferase